MEVSQVAQMRQRIADEYQAAQWGLSGPAFGTSRHTFITAKMENLGGTFEELTEIVKSPEKAIEIVIETIEALPEMPTRDQFVDLLWRVLGAEQKKDVEMLHDCIEDMWKTIDMLSKRFGPERAKKITALPPSLTSEKREGPYA